MDLAVVHPFLYTKGGAERVVLEVARHFDAKVFCSRYVPENTFPEFSGLDVEVLDSRVDFFIPGGLPVRVRDAVSAGFKFYNARLGDFDVVNAQGTPSEWIRNNNPRVVWYCHSPNREAFDLYEWRMSRRRLGQKALYWSMIQPYRLIEARIAPKIEFVFANSVNTQNRLKKYLNRDSTVLNPCVDYQEFSSQDYEQYFFYPSRITPEKRFEYAIQAFKKFKKKHPGFKLIIAGALFDERSDHVAYYNKIKELLGDDGQVLVDVPRRDLLDLFSRCYCVLYSPINEDFGLIPLEALASYKPTVAVNEGGPREVVSDGVDGFLVDSVDEMADRMSLLAGDLGLVEWMGKRGRKKVEKNFSWKNFMNKFEKVCKRVSAL